MDPIIKTQNLSVIYDLGKSSETRALDNVSVQIYPGEYIIFFGPSGCGKSTLLYTIAGLEFPTHGNVWVQGQDISLFSSQELVNFHRQNTGMIFQAYYLIPSLSVLDNVLLPQIFKGEKNIPFRKEKALTLLERFGIADQAKKLPTLLSGGQQQRVAICRSLINDPSIILADEPVGNLDTASAENVIGILKELNEKDKRTVILVTHDPRYLGFSHRVYHMQDGKITQEIVNTEKPQIVIKEKTERVLTQLEKLANLYPYLPKSQLQAKALANYFSHPLSIEEQERFEQTIEKYLKDEISKEIFLQLLDLPYEQGGVGFYRQRAEAFGQKINQILQEAEILRQEIKQYPGEPEKTGIQKRVDDLRKFLLDDYSGRLNPGQVQKLGRVIEGRVLGSVDSKLFRKFLDEPEKKGGVGLNSRTAKEFTKKLEIILAEAE